MSFAKKLSASSEGVIYLVTQMGDDVLDFYYLMLVPEHKASTFEAALFQGSVRLQQYGRVLHHGSGTPDQAEIDRILRDDHALTYEAA